MLRHQNNPNGQKGLGMIEVMVALLLLAVAVLGFSAMQMRAVKATDETLIRSDAMIFVRNISEDLRLQASESQKTAYMNAIKNIPAKNASYDPLRPNPDCKAKSCTKNELMQYTVNEVVALARDSQISVGADECGETGRGAIKKICLIASWNHTEPVLGSGNTACGNAQGVYNRGASCVIMETY